VGKALNDSINHSLKSIVLFTRSFVSNSNI
jgi:hypothetical protein